jgi:hypothetical protein
MKSFNLFFIFCLCLCADISAQKTQADKEVSINSKVNSFELSDAGTVILNTNDGLVGVYHKESKPVFEFTMYGEIKEESYTEYLTHLTW